MNRIFAIAALLLAGVSGGAQAIDWGVQGGLSGAVAVTGEHHLDSKSLLRGFFNTTTISGVGISSVGAAYVYDFQPHIYGGLGLQVISLSGKVSGWSSGIASYLVVGYTDKISERMHWQAEYNNFLGLALGLVYHF